MYFAAPDTPVVAFVTVILVSGIKIFLCLRHDNIIWLTIFGDCISFGILGTHYAEIEYPFIWRCMQVKYSQRENIST